jgi:hypothetical protein
MFLSLPKKKERNVSLSYYNSMSLFFACQICHVIMYKSVSFTLNDNIEHEENYVNIQNLNVKANLISNRYIEYFSRGHRLCGQVYVIKSVKCN